MATKATEAEREILRRAAMEFAWHLEPNKGWGVPRLIASTKLGTTRAYRGDLPAFSVSGWKREPSAVSDALLDSDIPTAAKALEAMELLAVRGGEMIITAGGRCWLVARTNDGGA